ncbi:MAG: hypothetical protein QXU32_07305 [Nitrososphaerales archaeon]
MATHHTSTYVRVTRCKHHEKRYHFDRILRTILYGQKGVSHAVTTNSCPECGGSLHYETNTKHFLCKKCGLYATREQIYDIRDKQKPEKKKSKEDEYLEWWLSKKK